MSKKLVVKVTGEHILNAARFAYKERDRGSYCPVALALKSAGFRRVNVSDVDDNNIQFDGRKIRHTKGSAALIDEFDGWVDNHFNLESIPRPRTLRFSVPD